MCEITLHVAQNVNTEQLQHHTLETWFVAGIYSGTSIYRFSRGWRKQTMNAGKRSIRETITHCKYVVHSSSKVS